MLKLSNTISIICQYSFYVRIAYYPIHQLAFESLHAYICIRVLYNCIRKVQYPLSVFPILKMHLELQLLTQYSFSRSDSISSPTIHTRTHARSKKTILDIGGKTSSAAAANSPRLMRCCLLYLASPTSNRLTDKAKKALPSYINELTPSYTIYGSVRVRTYVHACVYACTAATGVCYVAVVVLEMVAI